MELGGSISGAMGISRNDMMAFDSISSDRVVLANSRFKINSRRCFALADSFKPI